jgi:hypothetical protein
MSTNVRTQWTNPGWYEEDPNAPFDYCGTRISPTNDPNDFIRQCVAAEATCARGQIIAANASEGAAASTRLRTAGRQFFAPGDYNPKYRVT